LYRFNFSRIFSACFLCILALICASCRGTNTSSNPSGALAGPVRTLEDETGRSVIVPQHPVRIISLAPSITETVFAVGAGDRLVGDTTYCDYPDAANRVSKVGDTLNPNVEQVLSLKPDLVLVSTASQLEVFTKLLSDHNIPVYISNPNSLDSVISSILRIGDLLDSRQQAQQLAADLRKRIDNVESRVEGSGRPRVFYQLSAEPLYTAGRDAFITDMIHRAGGESVTATVPGAWPRFSDESALALDPDVIIIPSGDSMNRANNTQVAAPLRKSKAFAQKRIYAINGDFLSRPGPRVVDGFEALARSLHPELFGPVGTPQ
jgi:iron complex transport system substrate-binding protein